MVILVGECGCGKSSIERALIERYGYERASDVSGIFDHTERGEQKRVVCTLTPEEVRKLRKIMGRRPESDMTVFYIKVSRRDRILRLIRRGDDIDEVFRRDREDAREYRNIETAVDFILPNHNDFSDPENMAYWITDCLNGNFFKDPNG